MLETIHLSHLPATIPLYVILYTSLQNASFLRQQLLAGNTEFEYAFIDASMVCSQRSLSLPVHVCKLMVPEADEVG
jgi:EKC/KEOPS complex subunit CGI121/TPRKB